MYDDAIDNVDRGQMHERFTLVGVLPKYPSVHCGDNFMLNFTPLIGEYFGY